MAIQIIHNEHGKPQYAVVPYDQYEKLLNDSENFGWEEITYETSENDDETIPNAIVNISIKQNVSLLAAWRIYRGFSQQDVAEKLGTTQSTVSQWEVAARPQKRTREKLAELYDCKPEQLIP
ncbi:MAG: helix-turn-helix domain-containing protein [Enterobacteriaceae bacterium]|nr:helix-turn-helix domain-containing protein [Enterobacteriaceae bacterium]